LSGPSGMCVLATSRRPVGSEVRRINPNRLRLLAGRLSGTPIKEGIMASLVSLCRLLAVTLFLSLLPGLGKKSRHGTGKIDRKFPELRAGNS
jgi:hypothetical protein